MQWMPLAMVTASGLHLSEKRVSVRLLWPFLRTVRTSPSPFTIQLLSEAGIHPSDLARPETRLPHRLLLELLEALVSRTGDEAVGLRAGASVEPGDFDTFEHAARSSSYSV